MHGGAIGYLSITSELECQESGNPKHNGMAALPQVVGVSPVTVEFLA